VELWQDLTKYELFDADALAKGDLSVSQQDWLQAFSKLDVNKDGKLDASDLGSADTQCANHHFNATQEHYRKAVAMMAEYFPEFADFFIEHEPALIFFAEMNKSAPEDAPVPSMESMELFQNNSKTLALTEWKAQASHIASCIYAMGMFVYEAVGWGLSMMDVYVLGKFPKDAPPIHLFDAIQGGVLEEYKTRAKRMGKAITQGHFWTAANVVWDILKDTFSLGILEKVIRAAFANMSWWDWASTGAMMLATMLAQMATSGAVLIAKMIHQIVNAYNLAMQGKEAVESCTQGGYNTGRIQWKTHPSQCMDVSGGSTNDGTNIISWDCDPPWKDVNDNRNFKVPAYGSGPIYWATHPTLCLDVPNGDTWNGNNIHLWTCYDGSPNQQFTPTRDGTGRIRWATHPHKCIDMGYSGGDVKGTNVQIWDCSGHDNQKFTVP